MFLLSSDRVADHTDEFHVRLGHVLLQVVESLRGAVRPTLDNVGSVAVRVPRESEISLGMRGNGGRPRGI